MRIDASLPHSGAACQAQVTALRACVANLTGCSSRRSVFDTVLHGLADYFEIRHAKVLTLEGGGDLLSTVASYGDAQSETDTVSLQGEGVIGVAAQQRTAVCLNQVSCAVLDSPRLRQHMHAACGKSAAQTSTADTSGNQLAVPIAWCDALFGVLYVERSREHCFTPQDEDALLTLAHCLALALARYEQPPVDECTPRNARGAHPTPAVIRHYAADDSIFINDDYLIRGVAGAILWKLLCEHHDHHRSEFCNRELRLDPSLGLPVVMENLEARLILLQRRLAERCPFVAIEKTGRGRFLLHVKRPLRLREV